MVHRHQAAHTLQASTAEGSAESGRVGAAESGRAGAAESGRAGSESDSLATVPLKRSFVVTTVGGERGFRRRLLELGLVPGTAVSVERVAPLGDPLELSLRGSRLSIRRDEAAFVKVVAA